LVRHKVGAGERRRTREPCKLEMEVQQQGCKAQREPKPAHLDHTARLRKHVRHECAYTRHKREAPVPSTTTPEGAYLGGHTRRHGSCAVMQSQEHLRAVHTSEGAEDEAATCHAPARCPWLPHWGGNPISAWGLLHSTGPKQTQLPFTWSSLRRSKATSVSDSDDPLFD